MHTERKAQAPGIESNKESNHSQADDTADDTAEKTEFHIILPFR